MKFHYPSDVGPGPTMSRLIAAIKQETEMTTATIPTPVPNAQGEFTVHVWFSRIGNRAVLITPFVDPTAAYFDVYGNVCPGDATADVRVNGHTDGRFEDRCYRVEHTAKPMVAGRLSDVFADARAKFFN